MHKSLIWEHYFHYLFILYYSDATLSSWCDSYWGKGDLHLCREPFLALFPDLLEIEAGDEDPSDGVDEKDGGMESAVHSTQNKKAKLC